MSEVEAEAEGSTVEIVLLKNVQEMLNEEKWTRAALSNYSTAQFKDLDVILQNAQEERVFDDLKKLCDEHLIHTKNSIIALYLSGMVALSRQIIDDSVMISLVTIFVDNHKWNIVKYLCERILDYGESKFALRTLIDCCKNDNEEEALYGIWERLVKADYEEADLAKSLAEHFEKEGRLEDAVDYYKKSLHRYIGKQLFTNVREIWEKLLQYCPEDIDFFLHVQKRIARNISEDKAVLLLQDVCASCIQRDDLDTAISILKIILDYDEKDSQARKEITECFRKKYSGHSQVEEYIRISNLSQTWRNVHEAVTDFEKHIAFDKGNFVFHRTWGVGRIASVQGDDIVIDFAKKRGHSMSLKMAVNALQTLSKNHIWVLKATQKKEKLHERVKADITWTLKMVIRSFDNSCDIKRIKGELVPAVLSPSEWTAWSGRARDILKSDPSFGVSPDNIDIYTVRERPISVEEKLYNEFKAQRNFFDRVATIRSFASQKDVEPDSEYFVEMAAYFTGYLRSSGQVTEQVAASYLLMKELSGKYPRLGVPQGNFPDLFEQIEDVPALFLAIKDNRIREEFLHHIQLFVSGWADIYIKLFPYALQGDIITRLVRAGYEDKLTAMAAGCFENFRDNREAAVWLFKNMPDEGWYKKTGLSFDKQLITLIHILDITYREIENHRDTTENRKINRQVYAILFKDGVLDSLVGNADQDTITRIYTLIDDVKDLDPADKLKLRSAILNRYPDFKFFGSSEKAAAVPRGLLVTTAMYEEKQRQLAHIMDEEVPANSKEIAFALSLGDLRENAEYKAAKEKQEILNATVAKLKEEIERAQLFDPATVNTSRVSFGTKVILKNSAGGKKEEYTILGPWESDPENRVISYLSPFGGALLNKAVGEQFDFSINDEKAAYVVEKISPVTFPKN